MLKVGLHITAGAYRINQIDNKHFAIYYILPNSTINLEKAIDSDAIWGTANLYLENGNYIFLENAVLVPI